ncbi:MAG: signal recognition particle-docking protein FtsY [Nanoarchaeota archaeon]|mgnify:CR=1 FL=1
MFKFLKEKIKQAVSSITKKVEEDVPREESPIEQVQPLPETKQESPGKKQKAKKKIPSPSLEKIEIKTGLELPAILQEDIKLQQIEEELQQKEPVVPEVKPEKKKGFFARLFEKQEEKKELPEGHAEPPEKELEEQKKKGFFGIIKEKILTTKINAAKFEELFSDLEFALLENNVAYEVVSKIKDDLKAQLVDKPLSRGKLDDVIFQTLKQSLEDILSFEPVDLIERIKTKKEKPFVIVFVGPNGVGKTTTLAKIAHLLKKHQLSSVLAAGDSFRAGSREQLEAWGKQLDVKVIAGPYGADPASIAFDAISSAKANTLDVVLVDTAGRQHSNENLMREMEKIVRVAKPDMKILITESITGNDAVEQSREFNESIGLDGIILTKSDIDEKGGAMISVSYVTRKPILYLGIGQSLDDLEEFDKRKILERLEL